MSFTKFTTKCRIPEHFGGGAVVLRWGGGGGKVGGGWGKAGGGGGKVLFSCSFLIFSDFLGI